jgi:HTH-type transcriptional regulator / antitoxin HigA
MAARLLDLASYTDLLTETHPTVPGTEKENERLLKIVNDLTERPELSPEEQALLELLLTLIQKFEAQHYSTRRAAPHEVLVEMMRAHDMQPKDLYDVFGGSKGTTSDVLRGKRAISKKAAKALAERFHVSVARFLQVVDPRSPDRRTSPRSPLPRQPAKRTHTATSCTSS